MDNQEVEAFRTQTFNKTNQWKHAFPPACLNTLASTFLPFLPQTASQQEIQAKQEVLPRLTQCLLDAQANTSNQRKGYRGSGALSKLKNWQLCDFGSTEMGVSLPGGDLDISLEGELLKKTKKGEIKAGSKKDRKDLLGDVHRTLRANGMLKTGELVLGARVPVSKFVEKCSGIHCDLTIGNTAAVLKCRLMYMVRQGLCYAMPW